MFDLMGKFEKYMELVFVYFVLIIVGVDYFFNLVKNGIWVWVLINLLLVNDVVIVYVFYKKYCCGLFENGVKLYEFKFYIEWEKYIWYEVVIGYVILVKGWSFLWFYVKFFDIDGKVFVGLFNFDLCLVYLNIEVGLVVELD